MYHRVRRKMNIQICAILILGFIIGGLSKSISLSDTKRDNDINELDNDIIDFDDEYSIKYDRKYGMIPWHSSDFNKESFKYTLVTDDLIKKSNEKQDNIKIDTEKDAKKEENNIQTENPTQDSQSTEKTTELSVIPLELLSTTDGVPEDVESTTELDLTVIPLSTEKITTKIVINQTVTLPGSTEMSDDFNYTTAYYETTTKSSTLTETSTDNNVTFATSTIITPKINSVTFSISTEKSNITQNVTEIENNNSSATFDTGSEYSYKEIQDSVLKITTNKNEEQSTQQMNQQENKSIANVTHTEVLGNITLIDLSTDRDILNISNVGDIESINKTEIRRNLNNTDEITSNVTYEKGETSSSKEMTTISRDFESTDSQEDVPVYTELDTEDVSDVPEDYYDAKDVLPTSVPKTDALSVIFGLAGSVVESVVESVAERVVPKGLFDLFKRMQRQNEALEAEKLRSREENGGIGQFTRGVIKSISTGISRPLSQLMAGVRDIGSLDSDRGFLNSVASGVTSVADVASSMSDLFKDRVQAIYPGTVWCGDGHSPQARSGELGLFFFTDTCCRQHDACKMYIAAGETKFGLTNTGLFTRSHCSCDAKFRSCLQKTNSIVSGQIGLTYFNVLGPQCFRKAHPIVRCVRRTRITGLKCEEYELDYTKPKMWQWFDNETF